MLDEGPTDSINDNVCTAEKCLVLILLHPLNIFFEFTLQWWLSLFVGEQNRDQKT